MRNSLPELHTLFERSAPLFEDIQFQEFSSDFLKLSKKIESLSIPKKTLIYVLDPKPYSFMISVFALLNLDLIPCLGNWYWDSQQEEHTLSQNTYGGVLRNGVLTFNKTSYSLQEFWDSKDTDSYKRASEASLNLSYKNSLVIYTSGSTQSKACVLTLKNLFINALGSQELIPFEKGHAWGLCLPHFHVGGFSIWMRALLGGGKVLSWDLSEDASITHTSLVPTQLHRIQNKNFPNLQHAVIGGGAISPDLVYSSYKKIPLHLSYGMTEMGSQVATSPKIQDPDSRELQILSPHQVQIIEGRIGVAGEALFQGYLQKDQLTRPLTEGYFLTSDRGEMSPHLKVLGRMDRIFQCGGENISCDYIESVLMPLKSSLQIKNLRVESEADPEYGHIPVAYIESSTENILEKINQHLKGFYKIKKLYPYQTKTWKQEI